MKKNVRTEDITLVTMNVWFGLDGRGLVKFGEYESGKIRAARFQNKTRCQILISDYLSLEFHKPRFDTIFVT